MYFIEEKYGLFVYCAAPVLCAHFPDEELVAESKTYFNPLPT